MRFLPTQIEELSPAPFVLLVGAVGGVLRSIPIVIGTTSIASARVVQLVVVLVFGLLWWSAAVLLWWVAVRRRGFSIWATAWQVMLALDLADLLAVALSLAVGSAESKRAVIAAIVHGPLSNVLSAFLAPVLVLSPVRFLGSAVLVALGRRLPGGGRPVAPRRLTPTDPEVIT